MLGLKILTQFLTSQVMCFSAMQLTSVSTQYDKAQADGWAMAVMAGFCESPIIAESACAVPVADDSNIHGGDRGFRAAAESGS